MNGVALSPGTSHLFSSYHVFTFQCLWEKVQLVLDSIKTMLFFRDELLADPRPLYRGDEQV